jgi:hypothetical protein
LNLRALNDPELVKVEDPGTAEGKRGPARWTVRSLYDPTPGWYLSSAVNISPEAAQRFAEVFYALLVAHPQARRPRDSLGRILSEAEPHWYGSRTLLAGQGVVPL